MKRGIYAVAAVLALALASASFYARTETGNDIKVIRVPNGGLQPQVAVDGKGIVHLIYFKGEPAHGDVFYVRSRDWGATFSVPIQVNSEPGSATASGTIRGPRLAIGKNARVHVAWNGTSKSSLRGPLNPAMPATSSYNGLPMLYTRLNNAGTAFEPERNLMKLTFGLDGGGSVAADASGNVYVAWHGKRAQDAQGEAGRSVWLARSRDDGRTFAPEIQADKEPTGACGCCSLSIRSEKDGTVYIMYRSATETVHRDIYLLVSKDFGKTFTSRVVDKWNIGACPMSTMTFAEAANELLASWQTENQVYYATLDPTTLHLSARIPAPESGKLRKYPALAINAEGDTVFVWTEGTGWGKGGSLEWQVFDKEGKPAGQKGAVADLPAWSFGAAFARPDGGFSVIY